MFRAWESWRRCCPDAATAERAQPGAGACVFREGEEGRVVACLVQRVEQALQRRGVSANGVAAVRRAGHGRDDRRGHGRRFN